MEGQFPSLMALEIKVAYLMLPRLGTLSTVGTAHISFPINAFKMIPEVCS